MFREYRNSANSCVVSTACYISYLFCCVFSGEQDHPPWAKHLYLYLYFLGTRPPFMGKLFVFVFILFNYICIWLGAHGQIFCICICIFLGARPPAMGKGSDCLIGALPPHDEQPRRLNSDLFSFFFHRRKGGIQHGGTQPRRPRLNSATLRSDLVVGRLKRETESATDRK